jgi:hypothetical protein
MRQRASARSAPAFSTVRFSAKLICHATLATCNLTYKEQKRTYVPPFSTEHRYVEQSRLRFAAGSERLDLAADQAIAACGGDMHSTIRALILANEFLEYELCEMFKAVTNGRGKLPGNRADWFD